MESIHAISTSIPTYAILLHSNDSSLITLLQSILSYSIHRTLKGRAYRALQSTNWQSALSHWWRRRGRCWSFRMCASKWSRQLSSGGGKWGRIGFIQGWEREGGETYEGAVVGRRTMVVLLAIVWLAYLFIYLDICLPSYLFILTILLSVFVLLVMCLWFLKERSYYISESVPNFIFLFIYFPNQINWK